MSEPKKEVKSDSEIISEEIILRIEPKDSNLETIELTTAQIGEEMSRIIKLLSERDRLILLNVIDKREAGIYDSLGKTIVKLRLQMADKVARILDLSFPPVINNVKKSVRQEIEGPAAEFRKQINPSKEVNWNVSDSVWDYKKRRYNLC